MKWRITKICIVVCGTKKENGECLGLPQDFVDAKNVHEITA